MSKQSAEREGPQYINVARVKNNFADGAKAYFDLGPSITLIVEDVSGLIQWKVLPDPKNLKSGTDATGYQQAGFDHGNSGIMNKTAKSEEAVTLFLSSYGGDSFRVEVVTEAGTTNTSIDFVVWRRLWYDIVEMQRKDGVETFHIDNPGEAGMVISDVNEAFKPVFIAIEPTPVDDAPVVAEYEEALTDKTVGQWERGLPKPSKRYQGLKFRYVIVNKYPEEHKAVAFIRFETFGSPTKFSLERGATSTSAHAVRIVEQAVVHSDDYWTQWHFAIDGNPSTTRLDQVDLSWNIARTSHTFERNLSRMVTYDLAPDRGYADAQVCALKGINVGAFLLRCPEYSPRCASCPLANKKENRRPFRIYRSSFFTGRGLAAKEQFARPIDMTDPLTIDIDELLSRAEPLPGWKSWRVDGATLYEWPVYVEIEVSTAVENLGGVNPAVLGAGSAGNPHVYLSRGQIEEAAVAAGAPEGRATRIRQMMSRVGVHELGHALGLVADDATWRSKEALGHCGTKGCAMLPFDDPTQTRFHGEQALPSCHHYLRLRRLERPF